jgi:hypothetical protein
MADEPTELADRLKKLEDDLAAERAENATHRETLKTLQTERAQPPRTGRSQINLANLSHEEAADLAEAFGGDWTPALVQQNYRVIEAMFRRAAAPVLNGVYGLADTVDLIQTRQEEPDYKDELATEAEKVRQEHVARGEFISRKKATALVKAKRLEDPKYQDEIADRRLKQRETEAAEREAAAAAATTEGAGKAPTQTAAPSPTKGARANPLENKDTFERLTLDEKRKTLEDSGIAF